MESFLVILVICLFFLYFANLGIEVKRRILRCQRSVEMFNGFKCAFQEGCSEWEKKRLLAREWKQLHSISENRSPLFSSLPLHQSLYFDTYLLSLETT